MRKIMVGLLVASLVPGIALAAGARQMPIIAQAKTDEGAAPKVIGARLLTVRGTVEAIDKDKQTVTLKGPNRSLTVRVQDPSKLDAIKVGDPVVGKYYEGLMIEVKKPGEGRRQRGDYVHGGSRHQPRQDRQEVRHASG